MTCQRCLKENSKILKHHITYDFPEDVVSLCVKCHAIITSLNTLMPSIYKEIFNERLKVEKNYFRRLIFGHFMAGTSGLSRKKERREFLRMILLKIKDYKQLNS